MKKSLFSPLDRPVCAQFFFSSFYFIMIIMFITILLFYLSITSKPLGIWNAVVYFIIHVNRIFKAPTENDEKKETMDSLDGLR